MKTRPNTKRGNLLPLLSSSSLSSTDDTKPKVRRQPSFTRTRRTKSKSHRSAAIGNLLALFEAKISNNNSNNNKDQQAQQAQQQHAAIRKQQDCCNSTTGANKEPQPQWQQQRQEQQHGGNSSAPAVTERIRGQQQSTVRERVKLFESPAVTQSLPRARPSPLLALPRKNQFPNKNMSQFDKEVSNSDDYSMACEENRTLQTKVKESQPSSSSIFSSPTRTSHNPVDAHALPRKKHHYRAADRESGSTLSDTTAAAAAANFSHNQSIGQPSHDTVPKASSSSSSSSLLTRRKKASTIPIVSTNIKKQQEVEHSQIHTKVNNTPNNTPKTKMVKTKDNAHPINVQQNKDLSVLLRDQEQTISDNLPVLPNATTKVGSNIIKKQSKNQNIKQNRHETATAKTLSLESQYSSKKSTTTTHKVNAPGLFNNVTSPQATRRFSFPNVSGNVRPVSLARKIARRASTGRLRQQEMGDCRHWQVTETHAIQIKADDVQSKPTSSKMCADKTVSSVCQAPRRCMVRRHSTGSLCSQRSESDDLMVDFWHTYESDDTEPPREPLKEQYSRRRSVRFDNNVTVWTFSEEDTPFECDIQLPQSFVPREEFALDIISQEGDPREPARRDNHDNNISFSDRFDEDTKQPSEPIPTQTTRKSAGILTDSLQPQSTREALIPTNVSSDDLKRLQSHPPLSLERSLARRASTGRLHIHDSSVEWEVSKTEAVRVTTPTSKSDKAFHRLVFRRHSTGSLTSLDDKRYDLASFWHSYEVNDSKKEQDLIQNNFIRRRAVRLHNVWSVLVLPKDFLSNCSLQLPQASVQCDSVLDLTLQASMPRGLVDDCCLGKTISPSSVKPSVGPMSLGSCSKWDSDARPVQYSKIDSIRELGVNIRDSHDKTLEHVSPSVQQAHQSFEYLQPNAINSVLDRRIAMGISRWDSTDDLNAPNGVIYRDKPEYSMGSRSPSPLSNAQRNDRENSIGLATRWDSTKRGLGAHRWDSTRGFESGGNGCTEIVDSIEFSLNRPRVARVNPSAEPTRSTFEIPSRQHASTTQDEQHRRMAVSFIDFSVGPSRWDSSRHLGTDVENTGSFFPTNSPPSTEQIDTTFMRDIRTSCVNSSNNPQTFVPPLPQVGETDSKLPSKFEYECHDSSGSQIANNTIWEMDDESDRSDVFSSSKEKPMRRTTLRPQQFRGNSFRGLRGADRWDSSRSLSREVIREECDDSEKSNEDEDIPPDVSNVLSNTISNRPLRTKVARMNSTRGLRFTPGWDSSRSLVANETILEEPSEHIYTDPAPSAHPVSNVRTSFDAFRGDMFDESILRRAKSFRGLRRAERYDSSRSLSMEDLPDDFLSMCSTISSLPFGSVGQFSESNFSVAIARQCRPRDFDRYDSSKSLTMEDIPDKHHATSRGPGGNFWEQSDTSMSNNSSISSILPGMMRGNSFRNFNSSWQADSSHSLRGGVIIENMPGQSTTPGASTTDHANDRKSPVGTVSGDSPPDRPLMDRSTSGRHWLGRASSGRRLITRNRSCERILVRSNSGISVISWDNPRRVPRRNISGSSVNRDDSDKSLGVNVGTIAGGDDSHNHREAQRSQQTPLFARRPGGWRGNSFSNLGVNVETIAGVDDSHNHREALRSQQTPSFARRPGGWRGDSFSNLGVNVETIAGDDSHNHREALRSQRTPSFARRPGGWRGNRILICRYG